MNREQEDDGFLRELLADIERQYFKKENLKYLLQGIVLCIVAVALFMGIWILIAK